MGTNQIVSGDQTIVVDNQPVARHGDKTACGATLISSQMSTTAGGPGGKTASAQSAEPVAADLALQSYAESFDDLPPKAKVYVFDQANRAGVFAGDDALATAGLDDVSHDTHDDGLEHFQTDDPKLAARTARAQMGLGPYEALRDDQIMDADPHAPEARAGGTGVQYKHLSKVDTYGGSWAARFADTRPVDGIGKPAYAPGALPQASEAGAGAATAGTGARTFFNVGKKMMKASDDGLRQSIDIPDYVSTSAAR